MPKDLTPKEMSDIDSEDDGDIPANAKEEDEEAEEQVIGELKDKVEDMQTQSEEKDPDGGDDEDEAEADDDDVDEDEYEVEAITDHRIVGKGEKKTFHLFIKWKGFAESENTWEPEENLSEASKRLMEKYFASLGGRPDTASASKPGPKKRKIDSSPPQQANSSKKSKRHSVSDELSSWLPAGKSWESDIERIDTVDRDPNSKKLNAYIIFKNGKRLKSGMDMVYKHCPLAMLKFYEEHLKFTNHGGR